jgi:hypothetical protein
LEPYWSSDNFQFPKLEVQSFLYYFLKKLS